LTKGTGLRAALTVGDGERNRTAMISGDNHRDDADDVMKNGRVGTRVL